MGEKIVQILPHTDTKGLDEIVAEQDAYYGRVQEITGIKAEDMGPGANGATMKLAYAALNKGKLGGKRANLVIADDLETGQVDTSKMIFVFGSNEAGMHGAGAARWAELNKGAHLGIGYGPSGMSFALPTKDRKIRTLPLSDIRRYVDAFLLYARIHPTFEFQITAIGCGLAGYKNSQIAPMFIGATPNCWFDTVWKPYLDGVKFWGTF